MPHQARVQLVTPPKGRDTKGRPSHSTAVVPAIKAHQKLDKALVVVKTQPKPMSTHKVDSAKRQVVITTSEHKTAHHGQRQITKSTEIFVTQHISTSTRSSSHPHREEHVRVRVKQTKEVQMEKTHRARK